MEKLWNENNARWRLVFKMWHFTLADVLKKFRNNSLINHELCPSHYLSEPALILVAMLNMTTVTFPDPNIHILFEIFTGGRNSYICNKYLMTQKKDQNILYIICPNNL